MGRLVRVAVAVLCIGWVFGAGSVALGGDTRLAAATGAHGGNSIVVQGVVRTADGIPAGGVRVRLFRVELKDRLAPIDEAVSNESGAFELSVGKAGRYVVGFSAPGYGDVIRDIRLPRDAVMADVTLVATTGVISGTVHWDTSVITDPWTGWTETTISFFSRQADGTYLSVPEAVAYASFPGEAEYSSPQLPLGVYRVVFEDLTFKTYAVEPVHVTQPGDHVTGVDAHFSELRPGS